VSIVSEGDTIIEFGNEWVLVVENYPEYDRDYPHFLVRHHCNNFVSYRHRAELNKCKNCWVAIPKRIALAVKLIRLGETI
jgi:hypothetical protein